MRYLVILCLFGLTCTSAIAHHSGRIFDQDQEIVLDGTVSGYDWRNPHVYIYVDIEGDGGELARWRIEGDSTPTMTRAGWTPTTLVAGERVVVRAHPDRIADRRHAVMTSLSKQDHATLTAEYPEMPPPTIPATDIFSLWDTSRGIGQYGDSPVATEKGAAAVEERFREPQSRSDCSAPSSPRAMMTIELKRFSMQEDQILIQTEDSNVERIVYMDGRGHPADGERTTQGHSIGRWDGDVLVIDSRLFADHRTGNGRGLPSGAQKHLIERFQLIEGGRQLKYDYALEDPEFLAEPAMGGLVLDHVPQEEFIWTECDPETASLWLYE